MLHYGRFMRGFLLIGTDEWYEKHNMEPGLITTVPPLPPWTLADLATTESVRINPASGFGSAVLSTRIESGPTDTTVPNASSVCFMAC